MIDNTLQKYLARRSFRFLPLLLLALITAASAALNYLNIQGHAFHMARHCAEGITRLVVDARTWNAEHGGVYVPVSEKNQPNPYLQRPNRDLVTSEGLQLTMINPAYMTRQIGEITRRQAGLVTHLTSSTPLNPLNAPDPWEREVLERFAAGDRQARLELQREEGGEMFRYMAPLWVEESCLSCHTKENYRVGDLRGGISISFAAAPHYELLFSQKKLMFWGHLLGFLAMGTLLTLLLNRLRRQWLAMETLLAEQENTIAQRTQNLERSNEELRDFAYIASHDLQEPLRTIVAFGDRLMLKHADQLDEKARDYLERMQSAAIRMRQLIEDLLAYSRFTSKEQKSERVDLNLVLQEVRDDLAHSLKERGGRLEIGALATVNKADRSQLHRLFLNLIGNALKFQAEGVQPLVRVGMGATDGRWLAIVIEDNGIGFDEKYLDRIFRPFQRLHGRGQYQGTGMGLAICKKIVENHQGELKASSQPGSGTVFTVILPLSP